MGEDGDDETTGAPANAPNSSAPETAPAPDAIPTPPRPRIPTFADLKGFGQRLSARKVVQWGVAYIVLAFGLLQGAILIADALEWSNVVGRVVLALLTAGLPATLIIAWFHGDRGHERISRTEGALLGAAAALGVSLVVLALRAPADVAVTPIGAPASEHAQTDAVPIAVTPFENISGDASQNYFAAGLTQELITALSRINAFAVTSEADGERASTGYVVEGGVLRSGERLRINVQLVDVQTRARVWAESYDRDASDFFAVQDDIVTTIATEIRPQLYNAAARAIADRPTRSASAWELFMQATWRPGEAIDSLAWEQERLALAERAVAIDPDFAPAHSVIADKLEYLAGFDPPSDTLARRAEAAMHARRALELAPHDSDVVFNVGNYYWHAGRPDESVAMMGRTLELDPAHPLARILANSNRYTCEPAPQSVIDELAAFDAGLSPDNPLRWVSLSAIGQLYLNNGEFARAAGYYERAFQVFSSPLLTYQLAAARVQLGDVRGAVELVNQERRNWPRLDPRHYAEVAAPRRCGGAGTNYLRIYRQLADVVEAADAAR